MESIFHEKQEGSLCAQHCLNSLLQGPYFTAVDLAAIAQDLDKAEFDTMNEGNKVTNDYLNFMHEPSSNMDDSGYFSIQVLCKALAVWSIEMVPYNSEAAKACRENPINEKAYICNQQNHWLTIRKLGEQWFNLNSLKAWPELISNTYLSLLLAQLQTEGYSIFIIKGTFPNCKADDVLKMSGGVTKEQYALFDADQRTIAQKKSKEAIEKMKAAKKEADTKEVDTDTIRNKRLKYFDKKDNISNDELTEEEMLEKAIALSHIPQNSEEMNEEEMLEAALEMSMQSIS